MQCNGSMSVFQTEGLGSNPSGRAGRAEKVGRQGSGKVSSSGLGDSRSVAETVNQTAKDICPRNFWLNHPEEKSVRIIESRTQAGEWASRPPNISRREQLGSRQNREHNESLPMAGT